MNMVIQSLLAESGHISHKEWPLVMGAAYRGPTMYPCTCFSFVIRNDFLYSTGYDISEPYLVARPKRWLPRICYR